MRYSENNRANRSPAVGSVVSKKKLLECAGEYGGTQTDLDDLAASYYRSGLSILRVEFHFSAEEFLGWNWASREGHIPYPDAVYKNGFERLQGVRKVFYFYVEASTVAAFSIVCFARGRAGQHLGAQADFSAAAALSEG